MSHRAPTRAIQGICERITDGEARAEQQAARFRAAKRRNDWAEGKAALLAQTDALVQVMKAREERAAVAIEAEGWSAGTLNQGDDR